jgi:hypothetical protein
MARGSGGDSLSQRSDEEGLEPHPIGPSTFGSPDGRFLMNVSVDESSAAPFGGAEQRRGREYRHRQAAGASWSEPPHFFQDSSRPRDAHRYTATDVWEVLTMQQPSPA